ncbi:hypothetical protein [Oscillibacter sp.]|uniref:hypothetical protein n=1 Tax=Oscillibacter sp. TaxID=1945593 RepID=UPI00289E6117|nr:hypothetical protein [Oscillibacter sp.]
MMMVISVLIFPAQAVSMESPVQPDTIPENVAEIIAINFINESQSFPEISWTADTEINNTVTMYGTDGKVSAYSFELDTSG